MSDSTSDLLRPKHYEAFGRIVTLYAHTESRIKIAIAGMLDIELSRFMILAEPYKLIDLRNVAKSIAKLSLPAEQAERFCHLVGQLGVFAKLRNSIAHHRWTTGTRPDSIRPVSMDIRDGRANPKGYDDDEPDYTLAELGEMANELLDLHEEVRQFIIDTGLDAIIAKKMALASAEIDASEGDDATASSSSPEATHS